MKRQIKSAMFCGSSLKRLRKCNKIVSPPNLLSVTGQTESGIDDTTQSTDLFQSPSVESRIWSTKGAKSENDAVYGTISRRNLTLLSPSGVDDRTRGQLKLSITASHDHLILHVLEARQLRSKWSETPNTYVEISLMSDGKKDIQRQSKTVFSADQTTFDEKIAIEVMADDRKKRLKVAMYNKEEQENCNKLLGCMTFGVKHLISRKKQVNGWYYLLPEEIGRRKHLQVAPRRPLMKDRAVKSSSKDSTLKSSSLYGSGNIPEVNKSLQGLETITIVVRRGRQGFGFTVMGSSPVSIGKVEEGTHAESAGLLKGDAVVKINGQNVSRSTADSVAKIVKNSQRQIVLDVVRRQNLARSSSSVFDGLSSSSVAISYENLPYSNRSTSSGGSSSHHKVHSSARPSPTGATPSRGVNDTLPLRPSQSGNRLESRLSRGSSNSSSVRRSHSKKKNASLHNTSMMCTSALTESQYEAVCPLNNTLNEAYSIFPLNNTEADSYEDSYEDLPWDEDEELYFPQNEEIYDGLPWKPFECDLNKSKRVDDDTYASMYDAMPKAEQTIGYSDNDTYLSAAEYAHTTLPELSVSFCDLSHQEKARQAAIRHLILLEATFIGQMQYGIQRFSRPLRHCIISAREHRILFQNVEKLVAFSEYHLRQLTKHSQTYVDVSVSEEDRYVDIVGNVYCPKVPITCDAYERYSDGLKESLKLLGDLKTYEQFFLFLNNPEPCGNQPSIDDFLQRPSEHLEAVMLTLRTILSHTPNDHKDAEALRLVVEAFNNCLENINGRPADVSALKDESTMSFTSKSSSAGSRSSGGSSGASVDSQVLDIQERLVFPKNQSVFHLATPSRHFIYSGDLLRVEACMWSTVHVILFSDLLLVTRKEGDSLVVVEEPLLLPDIITSEFGKDHPSEFTLTAEVRSSLHSGWEARHLLFRTPSVEQQCTWKSLLEQRISSFRAHRELMTGRSHEIMF